MAENVGSISYDVDINTSKLLDGERKVNKSLSNMTASVKPLVIALAGIGVALSAVAVASSKAADNMRLLASRVEIAAGSVAAGTEAFNQLYRISRETNTSLEANASVFARLNQSMLQMGGTQQDTIRLTEILGKSMKISGASAAEASSAMLQFGQALGSGKLQGDELRSLLETAPTLMKSLADGIGVPVAALRKMGEEGKLTSDVVVQALGKAADKIDSDFQKIPQTLEATTDSMVDALMRLNKNMDDVTGTSAALTGIMDGLGDTLDMLAGQIGEVDKQSDSLNRKNLIKKWADSTVNALSYVADAADIAWQTLSVLGRNVSFVFDSVGKEVGGIGAQIAAVAKGDFALAARIGEEMKADAAKRRSALDAADKKSLDQRMTWGARIRQQQAALESGAGVMDAKDRNIAQAATGGFGNGVKPGAADEKKKKKGAGFDSQGYINDLVIANADGLAKIDAQEKDALDRAKKLLEEKKISRQQYEQAITLISAAAEKDRADLRAKEKADTDQWLKEMYAIGEQASKDAAARAAQSRQAGEDIQRLGMTPEQQAQFDVVTQARDQLEELDSLRQQNIITQEQYAQAEIDINRRKVEEIRALEMDSQHARLQAASSFFGEAANLLENYGDNSSNTYKNLFRISKAFALADSLVSLQAAIMKASVAAPFPANLATMAAMGSAGLAVISNLRGVTFGGGRQYGGAVSADSLYRVNETGAPEMFTASNGRQYMMPNTKGEVTPANKLGGGGGNVIIHNYAGADVSATQNQNGDTEVIINRAVAEVASQIASNNGQVWSALKGATSIQSKL